MRRSLARAFKITLGDLKAAHPSRITWPEFRRSKFIYREISCAGKVIRTMIKATYDSHSA